jgi:uncharacterized peroxidase-related enzyme
VSRLTPVDSPTAPPPVQETFEKIRKAIGVVPNMMRTMARSPVVLEGYLDLSAALRRGALSTALQEQIAIAIAEANACDYCLAAHNALGRGAGVSQDELDANRAGRSSDPRTAAALRFALAVVEQRGGVTDEAISEIRAAGFSDGEVAEIVAHVALSVFTNYFNRVAQTEIDFPRVRARTVAA